MSLYQACQLFISAAKNKCSYRNQKRWKLRVDSQIEKKNYTVFINYSIDTLFQGVVHWASIFFFSSPEGSEVAENTRLERSKPELHIVFSHRKDHFLYSTERGIAHPQLEFLLPFIVAAAAAIFLFRSIKPTPNFLANSARNVRVNTDTPYWTGPPDLYFYFWAACRMLKEKVFSC